MPTLTLRLADAALDQTQLRQRAGDLVRQQLGAPASTIEVETVFPDDPSPRRRAVFVVTLDLSLAETEVLVEKLAQQHEVERVYISPDRN